MKIRIGCVDGSVHESRDFTREELEEHIAETDGYLGTGTMAHIRLTSVEELLEAMSEMLKYDSSNDTQTFSTEMENGVVRKFNIRHVVWWEID